MGEVVVSSEAGIEIGETERAQKVEKQGKYSKITADGGGTTTEMEASAGSSSVVRWERFLPKMVVRVLLVEADDSTRQIIAALLRKCSYKVAAVSDGLKAWEVLKGSPCNIDLILSEVDLPSISGYALLALIMEHETCKNIPVIMMSTKHSVNTVYKCMLRGASNFLVKPLRKNELRNLWQHVWRKQVSSTGAGLGPPDESVQQKEETTGENNAISNHSSCYIPCIQTNKECIGKGSDDQSSCTEPKSKNKVEDVEKCQFVRKQLKANFLSDNLNFSCGEAKCRQENSENRSHDNKTREMHAVADITGEIAHPLMNPCGEPINLIGTFDNQLKGTFGSLPPNVSANKFEILPLLDLSLRRPLLSGSANKVNDERPRLNHSDGSAFSRYINKPSPPVDCTNLKNQETIRQNQISNLAPENIIFSYSPNEEMSNPIAGKGARLENANGAYYSMMRSLYHTQSGSCSLVNPHTPHDTESFPQPCSFYVSNYQPSSLQQYSDKKIGNPVVQTENKPKNMEDQIQGPFSSGNDQSGNSNFCSGSRSHEKVHVSKGPSEYKGHEESLPVYDEASRRSMQREAALNKFRMKRKGRCFEKKVRYESRKKLAEQRPRIKGQFVRQVSNDPQSGNSSPG